jgi:hypothetical protein
MGVVVIAPRTPAEQSGTARSKPTAPKAAEGKMFRMNANLPFIVRIMTMDVKIAGMNKSASGKTYELTATCDEKKPMTEDASEPMRFTSTLPRQRLRKIMAALIRSSAKSTIGAPTAIAISTSGDIPS